MISRRSDYSVARQFVDLHQQGGDNTLYLPGFVFISALLTNRIELIKK
ncbi:hypothetical protein Y045_5961 [Burkholderia pseudomallei MSHR2451]|nr:hypothetical protein X990_5624 [Burkholderia pseudomallei MSHR4868]KGS73338.1 hypothetical protein X942_5764 [Burkholderia pseudomallei MSHR5596]KGW37044.1 hypothetical protein Y045_5961 [Burkholderia pseudomallei MSHR2451]